MCSWIKCAAARQRGTGFASTSSACRRSSGPEHLLELVSRCDFQLIVTAGLGFLVRPPTLEDRRVAEPIAFHMIVLHLAHALDPERLPREVLAGAPAALSARHAARFGLRAGPLPPGMTLQSVFA